MNTVKSFNWIINGKTGTSSKTLWAAIIGAITDGKKGWNLDVPGDPGDFKRCYDFINECEVTAEDLQKVKQVLPWYAPHIDAWQELTRLYEQERGKDRCPKLYARLQVLEDESRIIAGWIKTGPGSWNMAGVGTAIEI